MAERKVTVYIADLDTTERVKNVLSRMGFRTLNELEESGRRDFSDVRGVGRDSLEELEKIFAHAEDIFARFEQRQRLIEAVPRDVCDASVETLPFSTRAGGALRRAGIKTLGELIHVTGNELAQMSNVGVQTRDEIRHAIERIISNPEAIFAQPASAASSGTDNGPEEPYPEAGKGFDYAVIGLLTERFGFKPVTMAEWFGVSRQSIYNIIEKRSRKQAGHWRGKELSAQEETIFSGMVRDKKLTYKDNEVSCCFLNDRQGDYVCLFVYDDEIKCFFREDLPENWREIIAQNGFDRLSQKELDGGTNGTTVYILKKPHFLPDNSELFRSCAAERGMTTEEYARFIADAPLADARMTTDSQITAFMEENLYDGKVYISSGPKNQWIRSYASRNGYSLRDLISFYGYESAPAGSDPAGEVARERHIETLKQYIVGDNRVYLPADSRAYRVLSAYAAQKNTGIDAYIKSLGYERTRERPGSADAMEADMQVRPSSGGFEDRLFAQYPLIGSYVFKPENLEKLNANARKYIDASLRDPQMKLSVQAEMQLTLALINCAKEWKSEENANFWSYITLQFGYRDSSGKVVRILQNALESAMRRNRRLFVEDIIGRAFKTTVVIHALTTRKSWMALFDFLFDFYKNNLNWRFIPGDPLIGVMVRSLKNKLGGDGEDVEISVSSHVYSFQEGIRKLVLLRPAYAQVLFEKLLGRIDALIRSEATEAKTYEEQLCEDWFKEKLASIAGARKTERQSQTTAREIVIDYSRIRARYVLKNETCVQLTLPDIRVAGEDLKRAEISVLLDDRVVHSERMRWYGNELGKTLSGAAVTIPPIPEGSGSIDLRVKISCDDRVIYDSEDDLYRRALVFSGSNEAAPGNLKKGGYTVVFPRGTDIKAQNAQTTEIEPFDIPGLRALFAELGDGFVITAGGRLLSFDSENGTEVRVIAPAESYMLPRITLRGKECVFAFRNSECTFLFGKTEYTQQFVLMKNGERIDFSALPQEEKGRAFRFSFAGERGQCCLQVISLADERLVFDRDFLLVDHADCSFNREFYFSAEDFADAEYRVSIDEYQERIPFAEGDEELEMPYGEGVIRAHIPGIRLEESTGTWLDPPGAAWYIGNIPQSSLLKVTAPSEAKIQFYVGGKSIQYDGKGLSTIGNVLHSYVPEDSSPCADIQMRVESARLSQTYSLAEVYFKERFLRQPRLWTEGSMLFWDWGEAFIGRTGRKFLLDLSDGGGNTASFTLDEETQSVPLSADMPMGNYRYAVSIETGNLFSRVRETIAEGDCVIGDKNALRFKDRRIILDAVTDESKEDEGHIPIRPCYIDTIEFLGTEDTSEGLCPVYRGVMYSAGADGERYEFSFTSHSSSRGISKIQVNPVRIVYVGETALCITDPDGDGLYYRRFYDRSRGRNAYVLTDHEYTKETQRSYSIADLYIYRTERI